MPIGSNARRLPGIRFYPITFTPKSSKYANEECQGVFMVVTNRAALQPVRVGIEIASALLSLYGAKYEPNNMWRLIGSEPIVARIKNGEDPAAIAAWLDSGRSALAPPAREVFAVSVRPGCRRPRL